MIPLPELHRLLSCAAAARIDSADLRIGERMLTYDEEAVLTSATDAMRTAVELYRRQGELCAALDLPASTPWASVLARCRRLVADDPARTLDDETTPTALHVGASDDLRDVMRRETERLAVACGLPSGEVRELREVVDEARRMLAVGEAQAAERDAAIEDVQVFRREVERRHRQRKQTHGFTPDAFDDLPMDQQVVKLREKLAATAKELDDCYEAHSLACHSEIQAHLAMIDVRIALGDGADEAAWPPGLTMAEAVGRLLAVGEAQAQHIDSALCMLCEGPDAIGGREAREQAIKILRGDK